MFYWPQWKACSIPRARTSDRGERLRSLRDGVFARGRYVVAGKIVLQTLSELHRQSRTTSGTLVRIQLLGQYPEWLAENAARAVELGSYGVDLNCGCPSKLRTAAAAGDAAERS